jgi:hypothetical protein
MIIPAITVAKNPGDSCRTCGHRADAPYRSYVAGIIVAGCVDVFHSGHLVEPSSSNDWHNRPEAHAIRQSTADFYNSRALCSTATLT